MLRKIFQYSPKVLKSLDAYALWASQYPPQAHNVLMEIEQTAMLSVMPSLENKIVLDLACGTGRYSLIAERNPAKLVLSFDNSMDMLQNAEAKHLAEATFNRIPLANQSVDVVICALALGHTPSLMESIEEIGRVLRPGGYVLISDFHPFQYFQGAKRTFLAPNGKVYAVEHYPHLFSDYYVAFSKADLAVENILEPKYSGLPIVVVYRLIKL